MKKITIFLIILCLSCRSQAISFDTLASLNEYAHSTEEFPASDNNDWVDPSFHSFYKKMSPGFFETALEYMGLKNSSTFNIGFFKDLLIHVTALKNKNQSHDQDEFELAVPVGSQLIIWGDLHGAFHSFVRCLNELEKKGIINNDLKLIKENCCLVFLGDIVSRSPYSIELLSAILLLIEKNPDKIFYIQGNQETDAYWENFSMRRRLRYFAQKYRDADDGPIPLRRRINAFFATLPKKIKLKNNQTDDYIYLSYEEPDSNALKSLNLKALILGEERNKLVRHRVGLEYLGFNRGIAEWSILSSPTLIYQKFFNFHYDSFVELNMASTIEQSSLTLFSQNAKDPEGFSEKTYNIIYGNSMKKPQPAFKFGSTGSITGSERLFNLPAKDGVDQAVYEINQAGGINGRPVLPIMLDDRYMPQQARKNIEELKNTYKTSLILSPGSTPTLLSYLDLVKDGKISVFFPITGAEVFRNKDLKNIVHIRASYADEVRVLIDYMITTYGIKKFAFFYEASSYGLPLLDAARDQLKKWGIANSLNVPYKSNQIDFKREAETIRNGSVEALGFFASTVPTMEMLASMGAESLINLHLFGISGVDVAPVRRYLDKNGIQFTFSMVFNPEKPGLEITKDYKKMLKRTGYASETSLFEGYLGAQLFFDAVKHIGEPVTGERLMHWFENLKNYKFKGLTFTFNPEKRDFSMPIWIETPDGQMIPAKNVPKPPTEKA